MFITFFQNINILILVNINILRYLFNLKVNILKNSPTNEIFNDIKTSKILTITF